jgi:hypothetical protein
MIRTALELLSNPIYAIVLALAAFSLTRLIGTDSFPPIEMARTWFYNRFPHDGYSTEKRPVRGKWIVTGRTYYVNKGVWLGELVNCPWCLGWWVSLAVSVAFLYFPIATLAVCVPFALRAFVGLVSSR